MKPSTIDRETFLQNLQISKLLTAHQFRLVVFKLAHVESPREIAKALASWKLITKFQARMLLSGRNYGFFLGPYRILDILGQGGMGRVYKAMHQTMNRVVALKVLSPRVVKTERARALFLREVQAAARLNHPNIAMAYDANEIHGRHFLAMEYIDGPNLEQHVREHGAVTVGLACEIIFQTANGLQHAHERGMVHRDIKPANLLICQESDHTIRIKILDFGLARLNDGKTVLVLENSVSGTPDFLSPEQSKDLHDLDIRADLYSLGCTFVYLLTGQVPFPGGKIKDKIDRHNNEPPPRIEELRADVPAEVADIVRKLMAKDPRDRYQTPDKLMEALAPHAAPTAMEWPIPPAANYSGEDGGDEESELPAHVDTEPRAELSTKIGDEDSVVERIDVNRNERRRQLLIALGVVVGLLAIGIGAAAIYLISNNS